MASPKSIPIRSSALARAALLTERIQSNPENRVIAKFIDGIFVLVGVVVLHWFLPYSVVFASAFFWSFIEILGRGQSPGKWLLGLYVVDGRDGSKPTLYASILRNMPLILLVAGFWGHGWWSLAPLLAGLAWTSLDIYFLFAIQSGLRSGDVLGATRVADYKDEHTRFVEQYLKQDDPFEA